MYCDQPLSHQESVVLAHLASEFPRPQPVFAICRDGIKHFSLNPQAAMKGVTLLVSRGLARLRHNHLSLTSPGQALCAEAIEFIASLH